MLPNTRTVCSVVLVFGGLAMSTGCDRQMGSIGNPPAPNRPNLSLPVAKDEKKHVTTAHISFRDGVPVSDCTFDGQKATELCTLDTGVDISIVPAELVTVAPHACEITELNTVRGRTSVCGWTSPSLISIGDGFELGLSSGYRQRAGDLNGRIGMSAFDGQVLKWDFSEFTMSREDQTPETKVMKPQALKRDLKRLIYIPVMVAGAEVSALFDTAVAIDGIVDEAYLRANSSHFKLVHTISGAGPDAGLGAGPTDVYELDSLDLAGTHLSTLQFALNKHQGLVTIEPLILGSGILRRFVWHLDLKKNLWSVE